METTLQAEQDDPQALFGWLMTRMPLGLAWTAPGGHIRMNAEAMRMFGADKPRLSLAEWVRSFCVYVDGGRRLPWHQLPIVSALGGSPTPVLNAQLERADGRRCDARLQAWPLDEGEMSPSGAVTIVEDCSWAQEREQRRDQWLGVLGHEIRGAIHLVDLAVRNAVARLDQKGAPASHCLEVATRNLTMLRRFAEDFDQAARLEQGRLGCTPRLFELSSVIEAVLEGDPLSGSELTLTRRLTPLRVTADPERVAQILLNLLHNAAKYSRPGPLELGTCEENGRAVMWLRDSGPGIPRADQAKLFHHYGRLPSRREGSGIGLWISRELALQMGGDLWLTSDDGQPTTFFLALPLD